MGFGTWQSRTLLTFALLLLAVGVLGGCISATQPTPGPVPATAVPVTESRAADIRVGDLFTVTLPARPADRPREVAVSGDAAVELAARAPDPMNVSQEQFTFRGIGFGRAQVIFSGDTPQELVYDFSVCVPLAVKDLLTEAQAREIAAKADACVQAGALKETAAVYNDCSGAWWIDLAVDKPGCSPACVVNASSQAAEVNWRCTGLLPAETPGAAAAQPETPAPTATATPPAGPQNLASLATATASSALTADKWGTYTAPSAIDGSLSTPWCEAASGPGKGAWILLTFADPVMVSELGFSVGYDREADDAGHRAGLFTENNRVKTATLTFSDGRQAMATFAGTRGIQKISLADAPGGPILTTFVKVTIDEVYPGTRFNDTCIAEIQVWGEVK